ncbi:MAG: B12-binding domain-containing radical SAM protein [Promethearchaeota archaeon]
MPWNLAYLAGMLEEESIQVKILDLYFSRSKNELRKKLENNRADIIGITTTTPYIDLVFTLARIIKHLQPGCVIVLGGWHPTALPEKTLRDCKSVDLIVRGEGEYTLVELCRVVERDGLNRKSLSQINGITFRTREGDIISNPDRPLIENLDELPFPAYHLLPLDEYPSDLSNLGAIFTRKDKFSILITSRGCPFSCIFCADSVINKHRIRFRSVDNVLKEIKLMNKNYGINFFGIVDPNFLQDTKRVAEFCQKLLEEGIKIKWGCQGRVDKVNFKLLQLMKKSGCFRIYYGVESGSPRILKLIKKRINLEQVHNAVKWTKEAGILVIINMMLGLPGETEADIVASWKLIKKLEPNNVYLNLTKPLPGSPLFNQYFHKLSTVEADNILWSDFYFNVEYNESSRFNFRRLTLKKIKFFQRRIMVDYYLSFPFLKSVILDLKSIRHLKFYIKAFLAMVQAL